MKKLRALVECLIFLSEEPIGVARLQEIVPEADREQIRAAVAALAAEYRDPSHGVVLKEVAGGYQFRSKPEFKEYVRRMKRLQPPRMSRAAMETLAIVAYKQPILKAEIERLRGVDVGGTLRNLLEKDLIRIVGRKNLPGRPILYGTTRRFLETFDLRDLSELPSLEDFGRWFEESEDDAPADT